MFGVLVSVTLADANPWLKLVLVFASMMIISVIMFESKIRSIICYCLMFIVVILASEIIPMGALTLMNLGTPESQLNSGMGRYIGMAC